MKWKAKHLFILLLLLSVVIQCAFGNFPFAFFDTVPKSVSGGG